MKYSDKGRWWEKQRSSWEDGECEKAVDAGLGLLLWGRTTACGPTSWVVSSMDLASETMEPQRQTVLEVCNTLPDEGSGTMAVTRCS